MPEIALTDRTRSAIIAPEVSITDAIARLDQAGTGVLLLCDEAGLLFGILTDGDVRRAILAGVPFDRPCSSIATRNPVVGPDDIASADALHLMDSAREFVLNQLPLITPDRRLAGLILRSDLVAEEHLPISAVIMAGGFGTRMRPLTDTVPKPMLPVGGRPLLAVTIERLREAGIRNVNVTTHYLADEIKSYFGDGSGFGVSLGYVDEGQPLGTAGGLNLAPETDQPLFVINGDVLTGVNFRDMLAFHKKHGADLTVGVRRYDVAVPYGVLECDGPRVREVREKPEMHLLINAGMYLLEPSARRYIPEGRRFDMTDLIQELLTDGRVVVSFPIVEYWLDVGRPADYEKAQTEVRKARRA